MPKTYPPRSPSRGFSSELGLTPKVVESLQEMLPRIGEDVVNAVIAEVRPYQDAWSHGNMAQVIKTAVELALRGFLSAAVSDLDDPFSATPQAMQGAFELGRGEARSGRAPEALLAAYRIGARTAWRELSATALEAGLPPEALVEFAALVFAWIDEVSDASVAGHNEEVASAGRVRRRLLARLGQHLIDGATVAAIDEAAAVAEWAPPVTLTAVLVPTHQLGPVLSGLNPATLELEEQPELDGWTVLLVPDADEHRRAALLSVMNGRGAVAGPTRAWRDVSVSYARALRVQAAGREGDTEDHLVPLVLEADAAALADLRDQVLSPLDGLRPGQRDKLVETLRSWLRHQGRREDVAGDLFIHPQTVRYRLAQLRDAYGEKLDDPDWLVALTVALAA